MYSVGRRGKEAQPGRGNPLLEERRSSGVRYFYHEGSGEKERKSTNIGTIIGIAAVVALVGIIASGYVQSAAGYGVYHFRSEKEDHHWQIQHQDPRFWSGWIS